MKTFDGHTFLVLIRGFSGKEATQLVSKAIETLHPYKEIAKGP